MFKSRWPHPVSLQPGTLNVLQAPNLCIFSQIMSDLDQTFRIGPLATTKIIFDVQLDPILQVSSQEWSTFSKPPCNKKTILKQVFSWAEPVLSSTKTCSKPFFSWAKLVQVIFLWNFKLKFLGSQMVYSRVPTPNGNSFYMVTMQLLNTLYLFNWNPVIYGSRTLNLVTLSFKHLCAT